MFFQALQKEMKYVKTRLADTDLPADEKLRLKKRLRRLKIRWSKHGARCDCKRLILSMRVFCEPCHLYWELQPSIAETTSSI